MTEGPERHFRPGDVVRRPDRDAIAVVLHVTDQSADADPPFWVLEVDAAYGGRADGICMWSATDATVANDIDSVDQARRLGLRGLEERNR